MPQWNHRQSQGDRGIMEFTYDKPGMYMFHQKSAAATRITNVASSMPSMPSMGQEIKTQQPDPNVSNNTMSTPPFPFLQ